MTEKWHRQTRVWLIVALLQGALALPLLAQNERLVKEQLDFGVRMAQRGLWSEALFRFRQAAEIAPERASVHNNLAVAYEALGLFDEALEQYREGLRLAPTDKGLKRNYSRFVEFYKRYKRDDPAAEAIEVPEGSTDGKKPAAKKREPSPGEDT